MKLPKTMFTLTKELEKDVSRIKKLHLNINSGIFEICRIFADIDTNNKYVDSGFQNIFEFGEKVFNLKKASVYNYVRIGRNYATESHKLDKNGKVISTTYKSNLTENGNTDFGMTQILHLFPLEKECEMDSESIKSELVDTGIILPEMTVKEIDKAVKAYIKAYKGDSETTEETETEGEAETIIEIKSDGTVIINGAPFTGTYEESKEAINNILYIAMMKGDSTDE